MCVLSIFFGECCASCSGSSESKISSLGSFLSSEINVERPVAEVAQFQIPDVGRCDWPPTKWGRPWTKEDKDTLILFVSEMGFKWRAIGKLLNRSEDAVKSYWYRLPENNHSDAKHAPLNDEWHSQDKCSELVDPQSTWLNDDGLFPCEWLWKLLSDMP
jgi:hypothetical protein